MATTTPFHVVIPGFQAISEFSAGHNDDCGPAAEEMCLACVQGRAPSGAHMNAIRDRDIQRGWFTPGGGNTAHEIYLDATQIEDISVTETPLWTDAEIIHQNLLGAMQRGNPCVLQLNNAGVLPGNERGVHVHFVGIGGADSSVGCYLVGNGDQVPFSGTYWVPWPNILAAQPIALLEFAMPQGGGPLTGNPLPAGWTDTNGVITAPNGIQIAQGFADYLRAHPDFLASCGDPVIAPYGTDDPGMDPSHGKGAAEAIFAERGLVYTPNDPDPNSRNVHPLWIGAMVVALRQQNAALQAQIAQLQQAQPTPTVPANAQEALAAIAAIKTALAGN